MRVAPDVPGKEGGDPFAFVMRQRGAVDVGVEINRAVAEVERVGFLNGAVVVRQSE